MAINGYSALTNYNSLFSGNSSSGNSIYDILTDYNYVKSGAYQKVLNATYGKTTAQSAADKATVNEQTTEIATEMNTIKSEANSLKSAALELNKGTDGLYDQVTLSDGTIGYDMEAIYESAKSFVDSYNTLLKDVSDATENSVLRPVASMTNLTKENSDLLQKIGITINKDNTLSVNETKFKAASINDVTSLFKGTGSYAGGIASSASIAQYNAAYKASIAESYSSTGGAYSLSSKIGSILDGTI